MKRISSTTVALFLGIGLGITGCSSTAPSAQPSMTTTATETLATATPGSSLDLQSHRGGRGETTEESIRAFEKSLDLGVTTLEFDIVVTADGIPAVWHDPKVQDDKCSDTEAATPDDPKFPYVGKLVHELTWAQLQTLDCGKKLDKFPDAEVVAGNKIAKLSDVFELTKKRGAKVWYNIETKIEAENPDQSATPQEFVDAILPVVDQYGVAERVMIQSFDWRSLPLVHAKKPDIPLVMLWDETTWLSKSKWTGPVDYDAVGGDIFKAAQQLKATVLSPGYSVPYGKKAGEADFKLVADAEFCKKAHDAGLKVVPWTINDKATMVAQIEAGADGIITDYPTMLCEVMTNKGLELPPAYPAK